MNRQQQMQDILKDTVDYYSKDPANRRSVTDDGDCMYTWGKKHCAIGRYMREEFLDTEWKENNGVGVNGLSSNVDYYLRHDVRGLDEDFWRDLQDMHDIVGHWYRGDRLTEPVNGLSDIGKARYVYIQDKIARGEYDD